MKKDDGGQAFPKTITMFKPPAGSSEIERDEYKGMSLRDYYAAKAPGEIPVWFNPELPKQAVVRPAILDELVDDERLQKGIEDWLHDGCYDIEELGENKLERTFLRKYEAAHKKYCKDCNQASLVNAERQYFAWRWYYADGMLKARNNE